MFTGLIEGLGEIIAVKQIATQRRLTIRTMFPCYDVKIGDSVAVNGACLTVENGENHDDYAIISMFVSAETLRCTTLGSFHVGTIVNLERAMICGGRFGGHIVAGHIDAVGTVIDSCWEGISICYTITYPAELASEIVPKGSITLDGISLTVNQCNDSQFSVNLIPETQKVTSAMNWRKNDKINIETDILGKYVSHVLQNCTRNRSSLETLLLENGFM